MASPRQRAQPCTAGALAPTHGTACADTGPHCLLAPCPWHQAARGLPPPLKMMPASCPRAKSSLTSIRHGWALWGWKEER